MNEYQYCSLSYYERPEITLFYTDFDCIIVLSCNKAIQFICNLIQCIINLIALFILNIKELLFVKIDLNEGLAFDGNHPKSADLHVFS